MAAGYASTPAASGTIAFGSVNDGSALVVPTALNIQETGDATMTVTAFAITGANASDFTMTGTPALPIAILNGGAAVDVGMRFEPGAVGARTATLTVTHDGVGGTSTYTLTGTGTAPTAPVDGVITNALVDAAANNVPAPYGPLERQTDMSTLPVPNRSFKIHLLDTRGVAVYATYDQLLDTQASARQVAYAERMNYQMTQLINDVETINTALQIVKQSDGGPYTQAQWVDAIQLLRALRWVSGFL